MKNTSCSTNYFFQSRDHKNTETEQIFFSYNKTLILQLLLFIKHSQRGVLQTEPSSLNLPCALLLQVGARCLEAGSWGAYYNVLINLDNITDPSTKSTYLAEADALLQRAKQGCSAVLQAVERRQK